MKNSNGAGFISQLAAVLALVSIVAAAGGCFGHRSQTAAPATPGTFTVKSTGNTNLLITPASSLVGRVKSLNPQAKIIVVSFPVGQLPANDTRFSVFHAGVKVGEIKITIPPPPVENLVSGDVIAGSAEEGDEVRAE